MCTVRIDMPAPGTFAPIASETPSSGWMWGAGLEYAFARNWSAKVEYNYLDLGTKTYAFSNLAAIPFDITERIHLVKFGLNYRLGYGLVGY